MAFKPGESGNPNGRPKGSGRDIKQIREAYKDLVDNNIHRVQEWINSVAAKDPAKAFEMWNKLNSHVLPKQTEELGNASPPIFILPSGVEPPKQEQDDTEEEDDE